MHIPRHAGGPADSGEGPRRGSDVRAANERLVLRLVRAHPGLSQSRAVVLTGLRPPTVYRIFSALEERKLIRTTAAADPTRDRKGRKPVGYVVAPEAFFVVGVDFWSRQISVVITDISGATRFHDVVPVAEAEAESVISAMVTTIKRGLKSSKISGRKILGIGIGCPGMVDLDRGAIRRYPRIAGMTDFPIRDRVSRIFRVPVLVHNNASVVALSEFRYGGAGGRDSLLVILVRSGVGGAFVSDGRLFVNHGRTALEIGHMSIDVDGSPCRCGARGCLEAYLSEDALVSGLPASAGVSTFEELAAAVRNGDPAVLSGLEGKALVLAAAVRNLTQLFSPAAFLVVSRSKDVFSFLTRRASAILAADPYVSGRDGIVLTAEEYRPETAGKGACDLVFDAFLEGRLR